MHSVTKRPETYLTAAIIAFFALKIALLISYHDIRWDEAVYLNMAKSLIGQGGYWEILRPPLWPLMLAGFMIVGDAVLLGEIFVNLIAATAAVILYLSLKEDINKWAAMSASMLLLFTDIWFYNSSQLLTGVLSASAIIFAFYAYQKEKYLLAGIISSLAFLTRFPAGIGFAALLSAQATILWNTRKNLTLQTIIPSAKIVLGFMIPTGVWMITNFINYYQRGFFIAWIYPLLQGSGNVFLQNTWLHNTQMLFYFSMILTTIPVALLAIFGLRELLNNKTHLAYAYLAGFTLLFFTITPNNQWRFALLIIPGLYVLMAKGAHVLYQQKRWLGIIAIALILVNTGWLAIGAHDMLSHRGDNPPSIETEYYMFAQTHDLNGTIFVSDPIAAWYAPNKAVPIYYEFLQDVDELITQQPAAVFYVPRSVPCQTTDYTCINQTQVFTDFLVANYDLVHVSELHGFKYFVFTNQTTLPALHTDIVYAENEHVRTTFS